MLPMITATVTAWVIARPIDDYFVGRTGSTHPGLLTAQRRVPPYLEAGQAATRLVRPDDHRPGASCAVNGREAAHEMGVTGDGMTYAGSSGRVLLPAHRLERRGSAVALVIAVAAALDLAAGTGVSYLAGFPAVGGMLVRIDWAWLVVAAGSLLVFQCLPGHLPRRWRPGSGAAGSGRRRFRRIAGAWRRARPVRAASLRDRGGRGEGPRRRPGRDGAGHAGPGRLRRGGNGARPRGWPARRRVHASLGRLIPVPGFALGLWAAAWYADRFRGRAGWRGGVGRFLASVELIRKLFACPLRW